MRKFLFVLIALTLVSSFAFAQKAGANIYGTVLLQDGSAIPGVAITLTGDVIGEKNVVTSEEGNFRFLSLPVGNYELKFELEGFKTVIRKNIRLFIGKNITLNIPMETTTIKEEIIITERPGAIDTRKTQVGVHVTSEMIKSLPTARNPWTIMNLIPGMMLDREDVGGNESGQQSSFYGHGSDGDDTTWNVDGANLTDPSAIGAAPAYLNINLYEELQVTLASNDIKAQTGGVQLNFVTKRAGNNFSGDFHLYIEDEAWEMSQTLPQEMIDAGLVSPGIERLYQYGVSFGGPIIKDKVWFFGSWGIQDIHSRTIAQTEDATWLVSGYGKVNFQLGKTSGDFVLTYDDKMKWGRTMIGAANQGAGTLWDQTGPGYVYHGQLQHIVGNLMLNAKFCATDGGFALDPRGADIAANGHNEGADWEFYYTPTRYYDGAVYHYMTNRNTLDLSLDGNYFAEGLMGGDHEIRFGVDYYTATTTTQGLYPNQRILFFWDRNDPGGYKEIWWCPDTFLDVGFKRISFYLSDTATFGKLTVNLGIRYDQESGSHNEMVNQGLTLDGVPIFTAYLGDLTMPAQDIDAKYSVISPRISFAYDITGDGKNVLKASFARYGGHSGNSIASHTLKGAWREIDVYWADDGDLVPEIGEWNETYGTWYYWSVDTVDPYSTVSPNKYGADLNSPMLDEFSVSFEKELGEDLAVSLTGFYKKNSNLIWNRGILADDSLDSAANWYQAGTFTFTDGKTKPYYERTQIPVATMKMNHASDYYNRYLAAVLMMSKKFSNKWMLDVSFTYSDWKQIRPQGEYFDLTNHDYFNEGVVAPSSGGSGLTGIYVNSRWQFKLSGLYQLPWGINITGVFQAREGYIIPYYEYLRRGSGLGWTNMYEPGKKFGDDRLPSFWMLNFGVEKSFKVTETVTATLFVDGYNVTNNTTTLKVNPVLGTTTTGNIERILNAGLFQFGIRVSF